ncbi:MAG: plastocyanin/azurin family copper-binding protein [Dehalococcoidia bacterium]
MIRQRTAMLAGILLISVFLAACGGGGGGDNGGDGGNGDNGGGSGTVEVRVGLDEMTVQPSPSSVSAGTVRFVATNNGSLPHELVVVRSDTAPGDLPVSGSTVDESQINVIGKTEQFPAGEERTLELDLEAGQYILFCNVPGHYQAGMYIGFTVR